MDSATAAQMAVDRGVSASNITLDVDDPTAAAAGSHATAQAVQAGSPHMRDGIATQVVADAATHPGMSAEAGHPAVYAPHHADSSQQWYGQLQLPHASKTADMQQQHPMAQLPSSDYHAQFSEPELGSPKPAQILRQRSRTGMQERRDQDLTGMLLSAHRYTSRVGPDGVAKHESQATHYKKFDEAQRKSDSAVFASSALWLQSGQPLHTAMQRTGRSCGQEAMLIALQQSTQQVTACTTQLKQHSAQQQALQQALHDMSSLCSAMQILIQQPRDTP